MLFCDSCGVVAVATEPSYCEGCLLEITNSLALIWGKEEDIEFISEEWIAEYIANLEATEDNLNYGADYYV